MIPYLNILGAAGALVGLYLTSLYSYLLFHSITEIFSIVISGSIFMIAWNSRLIMNNNYLLFLGISYLFVGCIDLAHTLAFKGMTIFRGFDANIPTQLWILGRYLQSISLLAAPLFLKRRFNPHAVFGAFLILTLLLMSTIFYWKVFPDCFIEGKGLTPFKIISEYVISLVLLAALALLYILRREFDRSVHRLISWSIVALIASELVLTLYLNIYDLQNLIGHYFRIIAFYLMYRAIIEKGLRNPYSLLLRDLKENEEKLRSLAVTDPLTNLANRRGFLTLLEQQLKLTGRTKQEMWLFFIDLDGMKKINDTLGHQEGDAALIETAAILRETFRETDIIGRMGGDEFAVVTLNAIPSNPDEIITRLHHNVALHNARGANRYELSLSVGAAHYDPSTPATSDELMAKADEAMYEQKISGKRSVYGSVNL